MGKSCLAASRLAGAAAVLLAARQALATTRTWYGNGSGGGSGGTGTWNTSNLDWTTNGSTFVAWLNNHTNNVADFGGSGGNVTITAAIAVNTLNFSASGYSLSTSGSGNLTLNGTDPTINTGGYDVTFAMGNNTLTVGSGTNTIDKTGNGTLTITNLQTGTGGIPANVTWNVSGGTLDTSTGLYSSAIAISNGQALGVVTGSVLDLNGGSLVFTESGGPGYASARTISVGSGGGAISDGGFAPGMAGGGNTTSPNITIAAGPGLNLVANDILEFDTGINGVGGGNISGAGGITIYGTGMAEILSTNNSYSGGTTITTGATLVIGGATSLGATTGNLSVGGTLNLDGNSITVGRLTSTGGAGVANNTTSVGDSLGNTLEFNIGNGTINSVAASSAVMSGNTGIEFNLTSGSKISPGTYTLISSSGGGLTGGVVFAGGQDLTVPANSAIENIGGTNYRLTLSDTGSAVTLTAALAPTHIISIMPLGSSITAGVSYQSPYNGGGYRSQLYENLINDGRFTPEFVGSSTANEANNPISNDLMTTVGQPNNEGHPGYTTSQVLSNLNANGNTGGNDGGLWLAPGNGVNPDYVTLNIGGNDFVGNASNTTAINNLAQIISELATLRPNATIIVSSILYRGDDGGAYAGTPNGPTGFVNLYNPYIPGLVYQAVLAGEHVSYVDMYSIITPNNSLANIGPDLVHPTQGGYDLMANAWYSAITTGQAFFTGNAGSTWNATGGNTTSWAMDYQRTTDAGVVPSAGTDVYFNGAGGVTTLGADFSVRSVNFTAGATTPITIGGTNTLIIGAGGITVQAGTGAHTINCAVSLGSVQTWSNVSTNTFTVTGNISGNAALTIGGNGTIVLSGNNTYSSGTTLSGGTLSLSNPNALAGGGNIVFAGGILQFTGNNTSDYSTRIVNSTSPIAIDTNGQSVTFTGVLAGSNNGGLTKTGNGTLVLSSSGSGGEYSGGVTLSAGTLCINGINGLGVAPGTPTVAITFAGNSTLQFATGFNAFTAFNLNRTTSIPTAGVTGTIDTNGYSNMTAGQLITGNGALGKAGIGTLTLTNSNTYSGGTTIAGGTLRANTVSATGTGNITVAAAASGNYTGGMLGGNGTVSGSVTLAPGASAKLGGIIAAGANGSTAGKLTTGSETWNRGSAYQWKIAAPGTGGETTGSGASGNTGTSATWDDVSMPGLDLTSAGGGNASFTIDLTNTATLYSANGQYSWVIAQVTGVAPVLPAGIAAASTINGMSTGNLLGAVPSSGNNTLFALDTSAFTMNGVNNPASSLFSLEFVGTGTGDNLVLDYDAAPEPGSALLCLSGLLPVLSRRRRVGS